MQIPSPCYVLDETALRRNLTLLQSVSQRSGTQFIMAFKAFAMWSAFPIVREYVSYTTASSLCEAQLAVEQMGSKAHTYAPIYTAQEFDAIAACSSHITFNSLQQYARFGTRARRQGISCGLRINPEYSEVETALYNPCAPGSRLGITASVLGDTLPEGVEGLHFHNLCESTSYDLEKTLQVVEQRFGHLFPRLRWLNMGGGHLITRQGYDVEHLINLLQSFRAKYPQLQLILEPGSAFAWQAGVLVATVQDMVVNAGIQTAMLDVSFACHMPDCLEMPYQPAIRGAEMCPDGTLGPYVYRMGGNSCLSGDYVGSWRFAQPLQVGDRIVFEDMIHYTMVKTTLFNGVTHPSIGIVDTQGNFRLVKQFTYADYKSKLS